MRFVIGDLRRSNWARWPLLVMALSAMLVAACRGDDDDPGGSGPLTLGDRTFANHGTKDAKGASAIDLEAGNYYFSPTFVRGSAGQKLTLHVENTSSALHNLTVTAQGVDREIAADGKLSIEVTMPQSGVLLFFCKYHAGSGMNGELLAGDAQPAAATVSASSETGTATASATTSVGDYTY